MIRYCSSCEAVPASKLSPPCFLMTYTSPSCHALSSGGHYLPEMCVPVEVSSPAGNFDSLGNVFWGDGVVHQSKFWFWHNKGPDFIHPVEFFKRVPPIKNIEKKNIIWENPVEVRCFDGIAQFSSSLLVLIKYAVVTGHGNHRHRSGLCRTGSWSCLWQQNLDTTVLVR